MPAANKASYADDIYNPITEIEDLYEGEVNDQEYDLLVFIGRFQPFHLGHRRVIDIALRKATKVLVLVGSSHRPRRPRNPWSWTERAEMIRASFSYVPETKLLIKPLGDYTYRDELWVARVQDSVNTTLWDQYGTSYNKKVGLIGCSKDSSSYYLKLFPQYGDVNVRFLNPLNATAIRRAFLLQDQNPHFNRVDAKANGSVVLDAGVADWLAKFKETPDYQTIKAYTESCDASYQRRQKGAQYPVQDLAADALVTQSGHILLIERLGGIGKGLLALPGGYVEEEETFFEAALRELREETNLRVPVPVIRGSLRGTFLADDPYRSERGRIISQVHHFKLTDQENLPEVRGADDAKRAFWLPIGDLRTEDMFEDHQDAISKMLGI